MLVISVRALLPELQKYFGLISSKSMLKQTKTKKETVLAFKCKLLHFIAHPHEEMWFSSVLQIPLKIKPVLNFL